MSMREKILALQDIPVEQVEVPEWGVTLEVRGMNGADRTRIMDMAMQTEGGLNLQVVYPEIVIATVFDPESGAQVFEPKDRDVLLSKSATALDRVAQVGMRLSGFTQEASDEAGKDSPTTPDDGSSTN